jgi:hypothetical protein
MTGNLPGFSGRKMLHANFTPSGMATMTSFSIVNPLGVGMIVNGQAHGWR